MRNFTEQEQVRRKKVEELKSNKILPWSRKKETSYKMDKIINEFNNFSKSELETKKIEVSCYGRIMIQRGPFFKINQGDDSIQIYVNNKNDLDLWNFMEKLDIGDIIWVKGFVMKTMTDEIAIKAVEVSLFSKALKILPEKYHGLKDVEERYRNRYVDLIVNKDVREIFKLRTKIIKIVREFFDEKDYLEVDTPILSPILSGASAKPFTTFHNALSSNFYLRIATELPLKKLIVGGFEKVYEIGRLFRNEGIDTTHNPEFTSIEFYEANTDVWDMMNYTEQVFKTIAKKLNLTTIEQKGHVINITNDFKKIEMSDAISEKLGWNVKEASFEKLVEEAKKRKYKIEPYFKKGHVINLFFEELIESELIQPTFVYGHPIEISPFANKYVDNEMFTERAELFIGGKEYANMFSELSDPIDQLERFEDQLKERESGNDEANEIDWDFVNALEYGMPPTGGCGIGIDRLVMLFTKQVSIREVLLFPHLKEKQGPNHE
ncbi:MAG: lysine--tRNA ligase [Metamycoplasmataceae bacterium]